MLNTRRLRPSLIVAAVVLVLSALPATISSADNCSGTVTNAGDLDTVTASVTCESQSSGSSDSEGSESSGDSGPAGCYDWDGAEVPCWNGDWWWNPAYNTYCQVTTWPKVLDMLGYWDEEGNFIGTAYLCGDPGGPEFLVVWEEDRSSTPGKAGTSPRTVVTSAIADLGLHPPVPGVGAYVYPGYYQWGLTWWVGAPMWLWVDTTDDLQWGTHTVTASAGGLTITATVTASKAVFDPGDGGDPVTCNNAGTFRGWDPNDRLSHHSPSGCEYTYLETNKMEDMNSRFEVSATVVWDVEWSTTDGQYGTFTVETHSETTASIHVGELHVRQVPNPVPSPR